MRLGLIGAEGFGGIVPAKANEPTRRVVAVKTLVLLLIIV